MISCAAVMGPASRHLAAYWTKPRGRRQPVRLVDVAQGALRTVNERRSRAQRQPLYLKWYSREDFASDRTRDKWIQGPSVLFVDSVSALETSTAMALQTLPATGCRR